MFVLPFPHIDPVLIEIGPLAVRWYALAYVAGLTIGWRMMRKIAPAPPLSLTKERVDDFVVWATLGVILGGRLGYILFYNGAYYWDNPLAALALWKGGMSFHGGLLGVIVAMIGFARRNGVTFFAFADQVARVAPIGLFLGRLANFINGELYGRVTDLPWAVVFPRGGPEPRHPSQLYEAALEGVLLLILLNLLARQPRLMQAQGFLSGVFLAGYGLSRLLVETARQPDAHLGFLLAGATMGQILSIPMLLIGLWFMVRALSTPGTRP